MHLIKVGVGESDPLAHRIALSAPGRVESTGGVNASSQYADVLGGMKEHLAVTRH
jgi:hypothetical protein